MNLINGDCIKEMQALIDDNVQVDSIVTDPPYGIHFMGKNWDSFKMRKRGGRGEIGAGMRMTTHEENINFQNWCNEWASLCLKLLKPGGYILAFSSARTYHHLACGVESAGFQVRDQIMWLYGSGFPKSLNIGKAIDKKLGNKRTSLGKYKTPDGGQELSTYNNWKDGEGQERRIPEVTKGNSEYEGWGTALKPAHEPIVMARKPVEETVAENVLKHGTGAINIDGCRISTEDKTQRENRGVEWGARNDKSGNESNVYGSTEGRFPANVMHDGSEEVMQGFPDSKGCQPHTITSNIEKHEGWGTITQKSGEMVGYEDDGSAARFFYCPKVSRKERNRGLDNAADAHKSVGGNYSQSPVCETCDKTLNGTNDHTKCSGKVYYRKMQSEITKNNHPTVKPLELMKYLCRLVTPKGGTVLDPFMGSGSTGMAAKDEGFEFIGIEREKDYFEIAESRINSTAPLLDFLS